LRRDGEEITCVGPNHLEVIPSPASEPLIVRQTLPDLIIHMKDP